MYRLYLLPGLSYSTERAIFCTRGQKNGMEREGWRGRNGVSE
jgi:hypothetical protein